MTIETGFNHIIFFGDSLTDEGIVHDLTARTTIVTLPSQSSGYGEAFTNGAVHAEVATELLGVTDDNYAVGYGHALGSYTLQQYAEDRFADQVPPGVDIFQPGAAQEDLDFDLYLGGQVQRYLQDFSASGPIPGSAAAFCIGLNDYSEFMPSSPETAEAEGMALVGGVITETLNAAAAVAATGVETIIFYNLPYFDFFPASTLQDPELVALGNQLIDGHNTALEAGAVLLEAGGVNVEFIDFNRLAAEIMTDPETFGLRADLFSQPRLFGTGSNPTLVQLPDGSYDTTFPANPVTAGVDLDQLAFMDLIHPTAAVHGILGVFSAESLTSETFFLGEDDDIVVGTGACDLILSDAGEDDILARDGADVILAGLDRDLVLAGSGDDIAAGGSGNDTLAGGLGNDVLADGAGRDRTFGGRGADVLIDGSGLDAHFGGRGGDAFILVDSALRGGSSAGQGGCMTGGGGLDTLYLFLADDTRTRVEADLVEGAETQSFDAIDLRTRGIEDFVFLDDGEDLAAIPIEARVAEANHWGLI
jgi:phospholipase/lecithinase/hemolysin